MAIKRLGVKLQGSLDLKAEISKAQRKPELDCYRLPEQAQSSKNLDPVQLYQKFSPLKTRDLYWAARHQRN